MRLRHAVGGVGALATLVGAVIVGLPSVATGTPLSPLATSVSAIGAEPLLLGGGALVIVSLVASAIAPAGERVVDGDAAASEGFERLVARGPEEVVDATPRTAGDLDAAVESAIGGDDDALDAVRERLANLVAAGLDDRPADDPGRSPAASETIATGTWTTDRVAGAFLGGPDGPAQSLTARVRHWLAPERERERRITRTVRAVERLHAGEGRPGEGGRTASGQPPEVQRIAEQRQGRPAQNDDRHRDQGRHGQRHDQSQSGGTR